MKRRMSQPPPEPVPLDWALEVLLSAESTRGTGHALIAQLPDPCPTMASIADPKRTPDCRGLNNGQLSRTSTTPPACQTAVPGQRWHLRPLTSTAAVTAPRQVQCTIPAGWHAGDHNTRTLLREPAWLRCQRMRLEAGTKTAGCSESAGRLHSQRGGRDNGSMHETQSDDGQFPSAFRAFRPTSLSVSTQRTSTATNPVKTYKSGFNTN